MVNDGLVPVPTPTAPLGAIVPPMPALAAMIQSEKLAVMV